MQVSPTEVYLDVMLFPPQTPMLPNSLKISGSKGAHYILQTVTFAFHSLL